MTSMDEVRQRDRDAVPRLGDPGADKLLRAEMDRRWLLGRVDRLEEELADQTDRAEWAIEKGLLLKARLELTDEKLLEKFQQETAAGARRSGLCLLVEQTRKELDELPRWRIFKRNDAARRLQYALRAKALEDGDGSE